MSIDLIVYDDIEYIQRLSKIKTAFKKGKPQNFSLGLFSTSRGGAKWKLNYTLLQTENGEKTHCHWLKMCMTAFMLQSDSVNLDFES